MSNLLDVFIGKQVDSWRDDDELINDSCDECDKEATIYCHWESHVRKFCSKRCEASLLRDFAVLDRMGISYMDVEGCLP